VIGKNTNVKTKTILAAALVGALALHSTAFAQSTHWDELSKLPFKESYPTSEATARLYDELQYQRAVQVYLWALPAMNMYSMREASEKKFGAGANVLPVWKDRLDPKTIVTTPNSDVIYSMGYLDLKKDGPVVFEVPPKMQGMLDDFWQRCLTDVGLPGPDKGAGGKYLILPPDYQGEAPAGYLAFRSRTYGVFVFLRAFLGQNNQTDDAVKLTERSRLYPLAQQDNPPSMKFPNGSGVSVNFLFPKDIAFFENLKKFIDYEPVDREDLAMRGMMASIGIVKGKPFNPDARLKDILNRAAAVAYQMASVMAWEADASRSALPVTKLYKDRQWENIFADVNPNFETDTFLNLDLRSSYFVRAYSTSPVMMLNVVGKGSKYPSAWRDADGDHLSGGKSYRLHLPPNLPAGIFWSFTVYDTETASGVASSQRFPSINSNDKPEQNADGSYDLFFGPAAPPGHEKNWLQTNPGKGWFGTIRLYGPQQSYFDETWKPGDIEKVK
jgi:hypothetical protein